MDVAESAAAALGDDDFFARLGEVGQQFLGLGVPDDGAGRDVDVKVLTGFAVTLATAAGAAVFGQEALVELKRQQARQALPNLEADIAAAAAIAAVGAAARHIFFAAERARTPAAVAGFDVDLGAIDEHHEIPCYVFDN